MTSSATAASLPAEAHDILSTWFGPREASDYPQPQNKLWWGKSAEVDADLRARFSGLLSQALAGELDDWATASSSPASWLALIILTDQLSRNIHRDKAEMYAADDLAVDLTLRGMEAGKDKELHFRERVFFYMPLMHAESVPLQRKAVRVFAALAEEGADSPLASTLAGNHDFAIKHAVIVEQFGRFPHRNDILGRATTPEEAAFLQTPGSSF